MESSTPIRPARTSLRRTLLRTIDTPIASNNVDDEVERSSRRSFIEAQKRASNQSQGSPWLNDSVRFTGEKEIKDHLQICTKLHAENKITERVAWQLQIIDVLRVMSKRGGADTLQAASSGLEVGAKVYSVRVDAIHAEGLKLASSMARFSQKNSEKNKDKDDDEDEPMDNGKKSKKGKRKKYQYNIKGPKNTIAKDPSSLFAPLPKLESTCFSVRVDSNRSTAQNLFTNTLPMKNTCHKFVVMSDEKTWFNESDPVVALDKERELEVELPTKLGKICKAFDNFVLDKWDPDEEKRSMQEQSQDDIVVFDDQGFPVAELDGPLPEFDANDDVLDDDEEQDPNNDYALQRMQREIVPVGDFMKNNDDFQRSEYSYNSLIALSNGKVMDRIWAGPSHWKLKFLHRNKAHYTGTSLVDVQAGAAKRRKKLKPDPQPVDFTNFDLEEAEKMLENMPLIKNKKRILCYNKVTLPLLDASCNELLNSVYELMIKPGTVSIPKKQSTEIDSTDINDNQAVNENGDLNMDNDNFDNDAGDHRNDDDFVEEEMAVDCQRDFMGANLVNAPDYVPKVYLPYAMTAKKMDMKKLKTFAWQVLTHDTTSNQQKQQVSPQKFSDFYRQLGFVLPTQMQKDISCALAFSALLHCCNDHNLALKQLDKDFVIESHVV